MAAYKRHVDTSSISDLTVARLSVYLRCVERLLDEESAALGELEVLVGKPIRLQTEALYLHDQYDVVLM